MSIEYLFNGVLSEKKNEKNNHDGYVIFKYLDKVYTCIIECKKGKVSLPTFRGFVLDIKKQENKCGVLVAFEKDLTKGHYEEALKSGFLENTNNKIPKVQVMSIKEILDSDVVGKINLPKALIVGLNTTFKSIDKNKDIKDMDF